MDDAGLRHEGRCDPPAGRGFAQDVTGPRQASSSAKIPKQVALEGLPDMRTSSAPGSARILASTSATTGCSATVKSHRIVGGATVTVAFDALGNITNKSDVGSSNYVYGGSRPHAVTAAGGNSYAYDSDGNMTSGAGRTLTWTSFNQLRTVAQNGKTSEFWFGAGHERVLQQNSGGTTTVYVGSLFEKVTSPGNFVELKDYIMTPLGRTAVHTVRSDSTVETRYLHQDALGSIDAVTNEYGQVEKRFTYDAWGKRATPVDNHTGSGGKMTRGFTDHEMLDDFGLIHMNGRVYDPVLARFLSADPFVQAPGNSQSYNRYSYCANNPLNATDPSGYSFWKDWGGPVLGIIVAVVVTFATGSPYLGGLAGGFVSGFSGSLLNGGSLGDAFKAGVIGGIVGMATAGAGQIANGCLRLVASGVVGAVASESMGGDFRSGFLSGLAAAAMAPSVGSMARQNWLAGLVLSSVVGGTASAIGGGKYANGAAFAAFYYVLNTPIPKRSQSTVSQPSGDCIDQRKHFLAIQESMRSFFKANPYGVYQISNDDFSFLEGYYHQQIEAADISIFHPIRLASFMKEADTIFYRIPGTDDTRVHTATKNFQIGGGPITHGGDINYFYQGMIQARLGMPPIIAIPVITGSISVWNISQFLDGGGAYNIRQIGTAIPWAKQGYYTYRTFDGQ